MDLQGSRFPSVFLLWTPRLLPGYHLLGTHVQDMYILHKIHLHLSIYFYICASLHYFAKVLKYIHRQRDNQSL